MYQIKLDKIQLFECNVKVEGSTLKKTNCRMVLEGKSGISYLLPGSLDSEGICKVDLSILKEVFDRKSDGKIRLEVITNDLFFIPWEDTYEAIYENKVMVNEVKSVQNDPTVKATPIAPVKTKATVTLKQPIVTESKKQSDKIDKKEIRLFFEYLKKNKITLYNLNENAETIKRYMESSNIKSLTENKRRDFINTILYVFSKSSK